MEQVSNLEDSRGIERDWTHEDTARDRSIRRKRGSDIKSRREEHRHNERAENRSYELCADEEKASNNADSLDHNHGYRDGGIEPDAGQQSSRRPSSGHSQSSGYTEEDPDVDHQTEPKGQRNVQQDDGAESSRSIGGRLIAVVASADVSNLCSCEREEQKHSRSHELA